jgi:predicted phosphodiesterase
VQLAFFGGIYNNYLALDAAIHDARRRGADALYCLGDLGAFGPHPDRVFPLLREHGVVCLQGNYDHSLGHALDDCRCGYTDPRDNHFARISYEYTFEHTSSENRLWLRDLPGELRLDADGLRLLLCHGSPRRTNEFLWESTTSTAFLEKLFDDCAADVILGTHTGLHWQRSLSGGRQFINVGVLGRPENDGRTNVWYTLVRTGCDADGAGQESGVRGQGSVTQDDPPQIPVSVEFVPVEYDHQRLAREMRDERLPAEFIETILTGWWTTCLEVLPAKERRRGRW